MAVYVENEKLLNLLIEYKNTGNKRAYNEIGKMFLLIAEKFLNRLSFINYTEDRKYEMISEATYIMCRYITKFDVSKTQPFAYFTQICKNAVLQYIKERKKIDETFKSIEYIDHLDNQLSEVAIDTDF